MNVEYKLDKDFDRIFEKLSEEYGEDFLTINGLDASKLSITEFLDNFVKSTNVADASIDSNSNIKQKDIATLRSEYSKPQEKLISYFKIFLEYKQKYGLRRAKKWFELEWNKALYLHDANTSNLIPYCFAYDLTKMVNEGLYWLPDHTKSEPARHLETFVDFVKEFISFTSNRQSGACGLPNLILYMYWYWKKDCENGIHGLVVEDPERFAKSQIQRMIFAMNQPYTRDGVQSAFINTSIFDGEYFDALFGGVIFPDGTFAIDFKNEFMQFQKWFLEEMANIKDNGKIFTFPVNTISLLFKDGKFIDEEFARWCSDHNMKWNDSNLFCDNSVNSLSNCCRLKSNITDVLAKRKENAETFGGLGYFSSIGGTALKVGSVKVSTINLARIAYESNGDKDKYLSILGEHLGYNLECLDIVRDIIAKNVQRGLLPNFNEGMLDFEHLYNTVGINGIYETMRYFGYISKDVFGNIKYTEDAFEFGEMIFKKIRQINENFMLNKNYKINIEQIPGEQAAVKFLKADKLLYPNKVIEDLPLYGNQWIPLGIKATLNDRIDICSKFDSYCNGGSIMHINIDGPFNNSEQAWNMLNYIANKGITYFAFNAKLSQCNNNHIFYGNICPECGEYKSSEFTRTVGFITKISSWAKERREEFEMREWMPLNKDKIG